MLRRRLTTVSLTASKWGTMEMGAEEDELLDEVMTYQTFHELAKKGNLVAMKAYLEEMHKSLEEVPHHHPHKKTMLHLKINARDANEMTALHYAAHNDHFEMCKMLMQYSKFSDRHTDKIEQITMFMADVDGLLDSQLDITARNKDGATALHLAAIGKKYTLELAKKVEREEITTETVIHECQTKIQSCVSTLLQWCDTKDVKEIKDSDGWTPLHWAAKHNNVVAAIQLLMFQPQAEWRFNWKTNEACMGQNVSQQHYDAVFTSVFELQNMSQYFGKSNNTLLNMQDNHGLTALHVCASHKTLATAKILLDLGADLFKRDSNGWTPMHHVASEGNLKLCKMLIEKAALQNELKNILENTDCTGNTPLHVAAEKNQTKFVKILLDNGSKSLAGKTNLRGISALHKAALLGNIDIMLMLASKGAMLDTPTNSGRTPMHFAAKNNHLHVVQYLLEKGVQTDTKDQFGMTPLLLACQGGNEKIAALLLENGVDVFTQDTEEMTCLHWACARNNIQVVKMLLGHQERKKLINMSNKQRKRAIHLAAAQGHHEILEMLFEDKTCELYYKDINERAPIHHAVQHGHVKVVKLILGKDPSQVHTKCEMGNTPLIIAALAGKEKVMKCLIKHEAPVDIRNCRLQSALTCCSMKDYTNCATLLLDAHAAVNVSKKSSVASPLHVACTHGSKNMVKLLLKYGAAVCYKDDDGNTPLDLAILHGHKESVRNILESHKWKAAIRSAKVNAQLDVISTPLREMIRTMPDMAQLVFSQCTIFCQDLRPEDKEYNVQFDFEFLDDIYSIHAWESLRECGEDIAMRGCAPCFGTDGLISANSKPYTASVRTLRDNHPLSVVVQSGNTQLLSHPLVKVLLKYKWRNYGRLIYYVLLLLYFVYLMALTAYLLAIPPPYAVEIQGEGEEVCFVFKNDANPIWKLSECECCQYGSSKNGYTLSLAIIIGVLASISLIKEGFQVCRKKLLYFRELDNYLEVTSYLLSILTIIDWSDQAKITGVKEVWQWQVAAVCLLASWTTLALFVRKLPTLGIYVIMLLDIFQTFTKFFVTLLLFVMAFGLFFYLMLQNQMTFQSTWQSIVKTSVMTIGELDYSAMFYPDSNTQCGNTTSACVHETFVVPYPEITFIVYIIFLIFMPIIVMNVLVGLAVDDIKSVQEQATQQKMALQINLALDVEFMIPERLRKYLMVGNYRMYPNKSKAQNRIAQFFFGDQPISMDSITKFLSDEKETTNLFIEQQNNGCHCNHDIKNQLDSLIRQNRKIQEVLVWLTQQIQEKPH